MVFSMQSFFIHNTSLKNKICIRCLLLKELFYIQMMKNINMIIIGLMPFICKKNFIHFPSIWFHWVFITHLVIDIILLKNLRLPLVHDQRSCWQLGYTLCSPIFSLPSRILDSWVSTLAEAVVVLSIELQTLVHEEVCVDWWCN